MKARVSLAIVSSAVALSSLIAGQRQAQSQSKSSQTSARPSSSEALTAAEKDVLAEINEVRAHPQKYVTYLEGLKPFFKGKDYQKGQVALTTDEGWSAVDDAIKFLKAVKPLPPLNLSQGLCLAATTHVKDQSASGATGHKGAASTMIEDRVKPFGAWSGGIGENLSYGNESPRDRVLTWLIDDGFASRGHRKRLLSSVYKVAGLSCGPHPEFGTMCALTLAGGFTDLHSAKPSTESKPASTSKPATTGAPASTTTKPNTTKKTTKSTTKSRSM